MNRNAVQARTRYNEVPDEGDRGDGSGCGNGRDEVGGAARAQLGEIVQRVRDGRLRTVIGQMADLDDAVAALNPTERINGKTIIRVRA